MTPGDRKLLNDHQAIIDAWFKKWRKQQQARLNRIFAKRTAKPHTGARQ